MGALAVLLLWGVLVALSEGIAFLLKKQSKKEKATKTRYIVYRWTSEDGGAWAFCKSFTSYNNAFRYHRKLAKNGYLTDIEVIEDGNRW